MSSRWGRWAIAATLVGLVVPACGGDAKRPGAIATPQGFGTAAVVIRRADGSVCNLCTYAARTREEHSRGLMGVTDLAGHDGMIFVYEEPGSRPFWMKDTVMPLTAAWFAEGGAFMAAFDMTPCPARTTCPSYGPSDDALNVLEVPRGALERLRIGDGAVLESIGAPCEPAT